MTLLGHIGKIISFHQYGKKNLTEFSPSPAFFITSTPKSLIFSSFTSVTKMLQRALGFVTFCYNLLYSACYLKADMPLEKLIPSLSQHFDTKKTAPWSSMARYRHSIEKTFLHQPVGHPLFEQLETGLYILGFTIVILTLPERDRPDLTDTRVLK